MSASASSSSSSAPSVLTFHRNYEKTYGYLTPEDFPVIDWAEKEQVEMLFPAYQRALLARGGKAGAMSQSIEVSLNLKTPFQDRDLFVNAVLMIEPNKRCAVYGVNGSGKTCLFEAITKGQIHGFPEHIHVHHMKEIEHNEQADKLSVLDAVLCSHPFRRVLLPCQQKLAALVETESDPKRKAALEANLAYVNRYLGTIQSDTAASRARSMLRVLGFDDKGEAAPLSSLSGGLRMRVALASAFFTDANLLLLDEPTNHLDMPSVLWLENRLRGYKGSYLLVTHDRTLLENVVTSVIMIQDLKLEYFACGFADFEKRKVQLDKEREKMVEQFLAKNRNIDADSPNYPIFLRYRQWQVARQERKKLMASKFTFKAPAHLTLPEGVSQQSDVSLIKVENVRFSYDPEKLPFIFNDPISYEIKVGTRVGIMGPNGAGKSTFLKLITGKLEATSGKITINPEFALAYFGQHSTKELKLEMTPIEFMVSSFPDANRGQLLLHLEKTSITATNANTAMKNLSFSQRSCVIFAKLTYVPPHLLIMDEPTNFLDLDSVDSLISATLKFTGGLIVVTHNRDFLSRCSRSFLSIVPGAFLEFPDMKSAERATYSFISALEEGRAVDAKNAILQNRGGGAAHTEEDQEARRAALTSQQLAARAKAEAEEAEKRAIQAAAEEKEAKRLEKVAKQRLDWQVDEKVWVNQGGKWQQATVTRNVPDVGVTVQLANGSFAMVNANKIKEEDPTPPRKDGGAGPSRGRGGHHHGQHHGGHHHGHQDKGGASSSSSGGRGGASSGRGQSSGGRGRGQSAGRGRGQAPPIR
jgi:ATP-binding cassette, subfamily F, member 3